MAKYLQWPTPHQKKKLVHPQSKQKVQWNFPGKFLSVRIGISRLPECYLAKIHFEPFIVACETVKLIQRNILWDSKGIRVDFEATSSPKCCHVLLVCQQLLCLDFLFQFQIRIVLKLDSEIIVFNIMLRL